MSDKKYLIVIGGPTASGKTSIAIRLAQHFNTEILSADSRQFYKEMQIGTAKPNTKELEAAKHHLIDNQSIEQDYSVGDFEREALEVLDTIYQHKDIAILVGGSGLFIKALCEGLDHFPEVPPDIRAALQNTFIENGIGALQEELKEKDPEYYAKVDIHNQQRLMRALEICRATGQTFTSFRTGQSANRAFIPIYISLAHPRQLLYDRINKRVDLMIQEGLVAEVKNLIPFKENNALQTVGYKELFQYFDGQHSLDRAIELIKQNTRRYAKRQMTWFRKANHWMRFHPSEWEFILKYIGLATQQNIRFYRAKTDELQELASFYKLNQSKATISDNDTFIFAKQDRQIIAAVSMSSFAKQHIIHSLQLDSKFQDNDILRQLIHESSMISINETCFVLTDKNNELLYHKLGFETINKEIAPHRVLKKLSEQQVHSPYNVIMKRIVPVTK